jgi:hypothetical protein
MTALKGKPDAVPTSDRVFSRNERLLIRAEAYAPGGVVPEVTARVLNRTGQLMSALPLQVSPGRAPEIDISLAGFAAAEYIVELNAKTPAGSARELIAFRVGR